MGKISTNNAEVSSQGMEIKTNDPEKEINELKKSIKKELKQENNHETLQIKDQYQENTMYIIVCNDNYERVQGAFFCAMTGASLGMSVKMYFFQSGIAILRKSIHYKNKSITQILLGLMSPVGTDQAKLSRFNMMGLGRKLFEYHLRKKNIPTLRETMKMAHDQGVIFYACSGACFSLGIGQDELVDEAIITGQTPIIEGARRARITLYI